MVRMSRLHGRGWGVKGPPPDLNLGLSVLLSSLCLVEAGQPAVVALIQAPGLLDWQILLT
jgi:hypothetical protein